MNISPNQRQLTPESNPTQFVKEIVGDFTYYIRKHCGLGIQEKLQDSYHDAFAEACPTEATDDVNELKYDAWLDSRAGTKAVNRVAADILFIPAPGSPSVLEVYDFLTREQLTRALGFTRRQSDANTSAQLESNEAAASSQATAGSSLQ